MNRKEQIEAYAAALIKYRHDPLGFVMWAFPWGVEGTSLAAESGPDEWQSDELIEIGVHLSGVSRDKSFKPFRGATSSGHGIGKSAQTSFIIMWALMTMPNARGVVTANSATQLKTKTWAEVGKWWNLHTAMFPIAAELFELAAESFFAVERKTTWRIDAIPNNPSNPAAFAGMHNAGSRVLMLVDEASEIADPIWDTIDGAMTDKDTELLLLCYGNPTKTTGRFKENVSGRLRHRFRSRQIDSRTVKRTNKEEIAEWVKAWGEDSDFVRVRVRGLFPRVGSMQLISADLVSAAMSRQATYIDSDPLVAGLDIARYGDDSSVLQPRRGRDARSMPKKEWRGTSTMDLAGDVAAWCMEHKPDALFIDIGNFGAGVYDRLLQLIPTIKIYPVDFGGQGGMVQMNGIEARAANKRASMWVGMREWLHLGAIPNDAQLESDLTEVQYGFKGQDGGEILLESKKVMKARGLASPDWGDALALTFAYPVAPRQDAASLLERRLLHHGQGGNDSFASQMDRAYSELR